jgi:hypothetical protein
MEGKIILALLDPALQVKDEGEHEISISSASPGEAPPAPKRPSGGLVHPKPKPTVFATLIVRRGHPEHDALMGAPVYDSIKAVADDADFLSGVARGGKAYVRVRESGAASKAALKQSLAALPDDAELVIGFDKPDVI